MKFKKTNGNGGGISLRLLAGLLVLCSLSIVLFATDPGSLDPNWWTTRGVIQSGSANNYAAVNQGQVKNMAVAAVAEFDADLPGGAGEPLHAMVARWATSGTLANDYAAVNIGQLKALGKPFYDRLIGLGFATQYPWTGSSNPANDYAMANIGQVKNLFDFTPALFPQITSPEMVTLYVGSPYSYTITAFNTPTSFSASGLPPGLTLNGTSGVVSGTATTAGFYNSTLSAINSSGTNSEVTLFNVVNMVTLYTGTSFSYTITTSGTGTGFAASGLPAGLTLNGTSGVISGTATTIGLYNVFLSSIGSSGTNSDLTLFNVLASGTSLPVINSGTSAVATAGSTFAYQIAASNNPIGFNATSLPSGLIVDPFGGLISGSVTTSGTYTINLSANNGIGTGTAALTLVVNNGPSTGSVPVLTGSLTASGTEGQPFSYVISATSSPSPTSYSASGLPDGLSVNTSTGTISGTMSESGTYQAVIGAANGNGSASAILQLAISGLSPAITSSLSVTGTSGVNFIYTITTNNNPVEYAVSGTLPPGLSFDTGSGVISGLIASGSGGVPVTGGTYPVVVTGSNPRFSTNASGTLTINIGSTLPVIVSGTQDTTIVGSLYAYTISSANGPATYSVSSLPPGLEFNPNLGKILGVPTVPGSYSIELSAVASGTAYSGTATSALNLTVANNGPAIPTITNNWIEYGAIGSGTTYHITAVNSPTSFGCSGTVPGLIFDGTGGLLSGTPTGVGTYLLNLSAVNSTGTATAQVMFVVQSTTNSATATIQLQSGSSPYPSYQTTSAVIQSDTSDPSSLDMVNGNQVGGITFGNLSSSEIQRGLLGFDLSMLPKNAVPTGVSLSVYASFAYGSSQVDLYQANTLFYASAASWSANSGTGSLLGSQTFSGTGQKTWTSGTNFLSAVQSSLSSQSPLECVLIDGSGEADPAGPTYGYTIENELFAPNSTPSLTITYTTASPPVIIPNQSTISVTGTNTSFTVKTLHGPTAFSATGLPSGLSINSSGIISGTATISGTYSVNVSGSNANGIGTYPMTIAIGVLPEVSGTLATTATYSGSFSYTVPISNGPATFSATGLPSGLSINPSTGVISGTANEESGGYDITIVARNNYGLTTSNLTITLLPHLDPFDVVEGNQNAAFEKDYYINSSGIGLSGCSFSATGLPAGLSITSGTDGFVISGTPTATGTSCVQITGSNTIGSTGTVPLTIVIDPPIQTVVPSQTMAGSVGYVFNEAGVPLQGIYSIPPATQLSAFVSVFSISGLPDGLSMDSSSGIISGTPTASAISGTSSTVVVTFTVYDGTDSGTAASSGTGTVTFIIYPAGPSIGSSLSDSGTQGEDYSYSLIAFTSDDKPLTSSTVTCLPAGLSYSSSTGQITGTPTSSGTFNINLSVTNADGTNTATLVLYVSPTTMPAPVINSALTSTGTVGTPFSYILTTAIPEGTTSTTGSSGLPSGLNFTNNGFYGMISGTPTATGTGVSNISLSASNLAGVDNETLVLTVIPDTISSGSSAIGYVGSPFSYTLTTLSGSATATAASNLPTWATFTDNGYQGIISGTPTASGTSYISLSATNGTMGYASTGTLALVVNGVGPSSATAVVGSPFTYSISSISGSTTGVEVSNLPDLLSVDSSTGVVSGTALAADVRMISFSGTYPGESQVLSGSFLLTILPNTSDLTANFQNGVFPTAYYSVPSASIISGSLADTSGTGGLLLPVGRISSTANERGLLAFDLSSLPPEATITSAALITHTSTGTGAPTEVEVQQAATPFASGTATWNNNSAYSGGVLGYLTIDPTVSGSNTFHGTTAFTQAVQQSYYGSEKIYLELLSSPAESGTSTDYVNFANNATDPTQNPQLVVTYTLGTPASAPVVNSSSVATGTVNTLFNYTITASNNPTSFSASPLPTGVSLNTATGVVSGTATVVGSTHVVASGSNAIGSGTSAVLTFNIDSGTQATTLAVVSGTGQVGVVGTFAPYPLVAHAGTATSGTLANTLVTFKAKAGGMLATGTVSPTLYPELSVPTGTNGNASVYLMMPQTTGPTSITATAGTASIVNFPETVIASSLALPSGTSILGNDVPVLSIVSGANQSGTSNEVLPAPFVVQAANHLGQPVSSLPLGFAVMSGSGGIASTSSGSFAGTLTLSTDSAGQATIYLKTGTGPLNEVSCTGTSNPGVTSKIYLTALTQSGTGSGTVSPGGGGTPVTDTDPDPLLSATNVLVTEYDLTTSPPELDPLQQDPTKVLITWDPQNGNASSYIIQEQISSGSWQQTGAVGASGTSFVQSGLLADQNYAFRIITLGGGYQSSPSQPGTYNIPLVKTLYWKGTAITTGTGGESTVAMPDFIVYGQSIAQSSVASVLYDLTSGDYAISGTPAIGTTQSWSGGYWGPIAGYVCTGSAVKQDGSVVDIHSTPGSLNGDYRFLLNLTETPSSHTVHWSELFYSGTSSGTTSSGILSIPTSISGTSETGNLDRGQDTHSISSGSSAGYFKIFVNNGLEITTGGGGPNLDPTEKATTGAVIVISGSDPTQGAQFNLKKYGPLGANIDYYVSISGTGFFIVDTTTHSMVGTEGDLNTSDNYEVYATGGMPPGTTATITLTVTNENDGSTLVSDSSNVVYNPGAPDYSLPIDEAAGPKYRKIAMNGMPLSDEKPQHTDETDQEKEETFVDALTLGLRHSTTDIYLPVAGSDFSVSARRDLRSEVWSHRNGLRPHEQPDKPFGICWSSNLAPNIHFVASDNPAQSQPDTATVIDETGAAHSFIIWYRNNDRTTPVFFPKPTAKNEQTPNLESLVADVDAQPMTYTFHRKYGSTLTFEQTPLNLTVDEDRGAGSQYHSINAYARLTQAVDRLGNTLIYRFVGANNLVPATITVANQPDTKISIEQETVTDALSLTGTNANSQPVIKAIWDANGNKTSFGYSAYNDGDGTTCELTSVVTAAGTTGSGTTTYTYDTAGGGNAGASETDQKPHTVNDPGTIHLHADLASITDPLGHTYGFTYSIDNSKLNYMSQTDLYVGYYVQSGQPRTISTVTMPDNSGTSDIAHFANNSEIWIQYSSGGVASQQGKRENQVTDATGFVRTYRFGDPLVIPLPNIQKFYGQPSFSDSKIICYQSTSLDYGNQAAGTYLGTEKYEFDAGAAMALSKITDFSGNITTFAHGDTWSSTDYSLVLGLTTYAMISGTNRTLNGHYGDPTSQTDALGNTKTFVYDNGAPLNPGTTPARIMTDVTDELGRHTHYTIDSLERRTQEAIYPANSGTTSPAAIQITDFAYGNGQFPGFMTQKTVESLSGDPSWAKPLVTQYTPDADGRVAQEIVDPGGLNLVTSYTYDANGNKLTATDPRGNTTWFSYDARNRLVSVVYADGTNKSFVYDARGNKTAEYDENNIATLYHYDSLSRVDKQARDMNGNSAIDSGTSSTDLVTSYTYNNVGSKLTVTDPKGNTSAMSYDGMQRMTSGTDALGNVSHLVYGTNAGGNAFDLSSFKPTQSTDPRGVVTNVTYDALYRPTVKSIVYQAGAPPAATTTLYDAVGNARVVTDPLGHQSITDYDDLNRPLKVTHADGKFVQTFYTSTGLKYRVQDELWVSGSANVHATDLQCDAAGRVTSTLGSQVDIGSGSQARSLTQSFYDAAGNVTATINPLGQEWDYSFDARNRKIQEFQPPVYDTASSGTQRPTAITLYDPAGRVTAVIDARGNETDKSYDAANRVTDVYQPAVLVGSGTTPTHPHIQSTYDRNGNVLTAVDANTHTTTNTYDALNRLLTTTDAAGNVVGNQYDSVGNKTKVTDGNGHSTTFTYDGLNRNTTINDALGNTTQFRYDGVNKTQRLDAKRQTTTYLYDVRNRLTTVSYASASPAINSVRNYTYDAGGNLLSVAEPGKAGAADVAYSYDGLNRAVTETSSGLTHTYSYDLANNRMQTVYGGSSRTIASTYDALNRLSTMTENSTRVSSYAYDLNGNATQKVLPNSDTETSTYDALNRASSQVALSGTHSLYNYAYIYDLAGNVLGETETYPTTGTTLSNRTVTNTYDNINRLSSEADLISGTTATTSYAYDANNNRLTKGISTGTTTYHYNAENQLTDYSDGTTSATLTYDANGNRSTKMVGSGTDVYSYDFENRLVGLVKNISGTGITTGTYAYGYDYRTRRVTRDESATMGGELIKVVFSGGTSIQELSGTATRVEYIRGSDYGGGVGGVLYTLRGGTLSYTHENRRGDVVAKTGTNGSLTYLAEYQAFGEHPIQSGSTADRQKANTKDEDPNGLKNEGMRPYDLEADVFISADPAGFVDGPNLYTYVRQNPWTSFDPEGLNTEDADAEKAKAADAAGHHFQAFMYGLHGVMEMLNPFDPNSGLRQVAPEMSSGVANAKAHVDAAVQSGKIDPVSGGIARFGLWVGGMGSDLSFGVSNYMAAGDQLGTHNPLSIGKAGFMNFGANIGKDGAAFGEHPSFGTAANLIEDIGNTALLADGGVGLYRGGMSLAGPSKVAVPHGTGFAVQSQSDAALAALSDVRGGATVYRQGAFGLQNTSDAQFWSLKNPALTEGYASKMGLPGGAGKPDWIMGGTVKSGGSVITRPAPGLGTNPGGDMEAVTPPNGVGNLWFHMPDD